MSKSTVSQHLLYNEDFNERVIAHSETKGPIRPASTAYVNNSKSLGQGLTTRVDRPLAITDLADASSYFFALGAKVQAREPGRPGPFDLYSIPALSAATGARFRCPDAPNRSVDFPLIDQITFLPENRYNFDLAKISMAKKQTIGT
jgi:hypothetical protein